MRKVAAYLLVALPVLLVCNPVWSQTHFGVTSSTVALWTFSSKTGTTFTDAGPNALALSGANNFSLASSPLDSAVVFTGSNTYLTHASTTALTIAGTGQITFEARIYLTSYPPSTIYNHEGTIMGNYEGLRFMIGIDGSLYAGAQKISGGIGYWYGTITSPGVVPLNQWVDVAVAFDNSVNGAAYAYVNGNPVQLYKGDAVTNDPWRTSTSSFCVGGVTTDAQPFNGQIEEVRVSNTIVLGAGFPVIGNTNPPTVPSNLTYSKNPAAYAVNVAIANNTPTVSGNPTSYSVTPVLPAGLSLNTTTGVISGTPTTLTAAADYTVTASNGGGSTTATVNISVLAAPSGLAYSANPAAYFVGTAIAPNTPSVTGTISGYSVSPALPAGLTLNTTTGVITGTPTIASAATNYTVSVFNGPVSSTAIVNIAVLAAPSSLSYSSSSPVYGVNVAIAVNTPTVSGSAPITYSVIPILPAGLTLNTNTGIISGTPTAPSLSVSYFVTASNSVGSTTATLNITVLAAPSGLSYSSNPAQYVVGTAIAANTPTVIGTVAGYAVTPALPTGLTLNTTTGIITGTPLVPASSNYTVTASNAAGSATSVVNITARLVPSALYYSSSTALYVVGTAITANTPTLTGSAPFTFSVAPPLPAGLTLNTTSGIITGTCTAATAAANYTITSSNPAGSTTATVTISVIPPISVLPKIGMRSFRVQISGSASLNLGLLEAQDARFEILDMWGRVIWTKDIARGEKGISWDGKSTNGGTVSPGIYFARIDRDAQKFVYAP